MNIEELYKKLEFQAAMRPKSLAAPQGSGLGRIFNQLPFIFFRSLESPYNLTTHSTDLHF